MHLMNLWMVYLNSVKLKDILSNIHIGIQKENTHMLSKIEITDLFIWIFNHNKKRNSNCSKRMDNLFMLK
jgi:hypothetical protein